MNVVGKINSRNRKLEELRTRNIEKYNWLIKELQIDHSPAPLEDLGPTVLSKKETRMAAAREYFEAMKKAKLEEFRQKLAEERKTFEKEKEIELKKIETELAEFGVHDVSSLQQTFEALKLGLPFVEPKKPWTTPRREKLAAKFKLYGHRRKESLEGTQADYQTF